MTYKKVRIAAYGMTVMMAASSAGIHAQAVKLAEVLPAAGIGITFSNDTTLAKIREDVLAEAALDENMKLSVSEMKRYLEERKAAPGTIVSASIVKAAGVQEALAEIEIKQEALARAERLKGEPLPRQTAAGNTVIATVANAASNEAIVFDGADSIIEEQIPVANSGDYAFAENALTIFQQAAQGGKTLSGDMTEPAASYAAASGTSQAETVSSSGTSGTSGTPSSSGTSGTSGTPSSSGTSETVSAPETSGTASATEKSDKTESSVSGNDVKTETEKADPVKEIENKVIETTQSTAELTATEAASMTEEEKEFSDLVIARVKRYVNVRSDASENSEVVGKLYDKSVGTYLSEKDGWYEIKSGNVTGYVKAEYCVTGREAVDLAREIGTRIATVTTTTLKVREDASTESAVLGLVPIEEELTVVEEQDGWVKVDIEEGYGWVSKDYVSLRTDFVKAESKAEEDARLAKEAEERRKAQAAATANSSKPESGSSKNYNSASSFIPAGGGSASGNAVAQFALQFKGNPYVYGGTSLTNGADCSGFVMSVYKNFGVNLPHSSSADRHVGSAVASLEEAQPGDLICYSGHVALYIGDNQIVHASTKKTGIIVSRANYRNILAIRRIF